MGPKSWAAQGRMAGAWGHSVGVRGGPQTLFERCRKAAKVLPQASEEGQLPYILEYKASGFPPKFIPQKREGCLISASLCSFTLMRPLFNYFILKTQVLLAKCTLD